MFSKLVKHEFRATARIIPFIFMVTVFLGLVHVLTVRLNLGVLSVFSLILTVLMCFAQVIIAYALVIWRYYKSMYSNEAYLTHTLPVHPSMLLWSKLLVGFVWTAASYITAIGVGFGVAAAHMFKTAGEWQNFVTGYHQILKAIGIEHSQLLMWFVIAAALLISIVLVLSEVYFSISIGSTSKMHSLGIGGPILVFLGTDMSLRILSALAALFIPLGVRFTTNASGELIGLKFVVQSMFSQVVDSLNSTGMASSSGDSGIAGIGSYLLLPVFVAALLYTASRVITRHTSIK